MRILLYGSNGWIGSQFLKSIVNTHDVTCGTTRVDDIVDLRKELAFVKPTHVISFIGRTSGVYKGTEIRSIDYLEKPGKLVENIRDNIFSPTVLAVLSTEYNYHYTYLGTGCIFNYDSTHDTENGYTEEDTPNFFDSSYSIVKGYTDILMHLFPRVLNLRIRMPITNKNHPRNFITKILNYKKICSIPNSMTVLTDFFPVWLNLMERQITGTFNCTNPGVITHNEILEMYKNIIDPSFTWENFTIDEQAQILSAGRSNNYLCTDKLVEYNIPHIQQSIKKVLETWTTTGN